jgi:hypothetical protein
MSQTGDVAVIDAWNSALPAGVIVHVGVVLGSPSRPPVPSVITPA